MAVFNVISEQRTKHATRLIPVRAMYPVNLLDHAQLSVICSWGPGVCYYSSRRTLRSQISSPCGVLGFCEALVCICQFCLVAGDIVFVVHALGRQGFLLRVVLGREQ